MISLGVPALLGLALFWLDGPVSEIRTLVFTTMVISQLLHAFNFRSTNKTVFSPASFGNRFLWGAVGISLLVQITVLYLPVVQPIFKTHPLGLTD